MRMVANRLMALLLGVAVAGSLMGPASEASAQGSASAKVKGPVEVTLHVTSVSPEAPPVLRSLETLVGLFGNQLKVVLEFTGTFEEQKLVLDGGDKELQGDLLLACAQKHLAKTPVFLRFVNCMASEALALEPSLALCYEAMAVAKASRDSIDACRKGADGQKLLEESVRRSINANRNSSPTVALQGQTLMGGVRTLKLAHQICDLQEKRAGICGKLPVIKTYKVIVLTDSRCTDPTLLCTEDFLDEVTNILDTQVFVDGVEYVKMDYATPEGKSLFMKEKPAALPAFLIEKGVAGDEEIMGKVGRFLKPTATGENFYLNAGQNYDPTREICDNQKDDNEDGKVDCDDATCARALACREAKPGLVELFIMSYCPYGVLAVKELQRLQEAFGKDITIQIHYVLGAEGDVPQSLHGEEEVLEDARQLCVAQNSPEKLLPYMWCIYEDSEASNPKACMEKLKISTEQIDACANGEAGKKLLMAEVALGELFGVDASPTWVVNGKTKFNSIDASEVAEKICDGSLKSAGCEKKLPKKDDQPTGSCN